MSHTLQIEYTDEFPTELKASAEKCLRDGIEFLENIPRPTAHPEIEFLTPNFPEMQFKIGENTWSHGLFSTKSMAGWCVIDYRSNGDLLINSTPCWTVAGVDVEIATTASIIFVLDQYFVKDKHPEQHLLRQIQYLDWLSGKDARAKSLVDQWEEHKSQQEQNDKDAQYQAQLQDKHYQQMRKYRFDTARRMPQWYVDKHGSEPQCQGAYLITTDGFVTGASEAWTYPDGIPATSSPLPQPNLAVTQVQTPSAPLPIPTPPPPMEPMEYISTTDQQAQVRSWQELHSNNVGTSTAGSCQDHDM